MTTTQERRSRWITNSKIHVPGLPTALPASLAPEQVDSYVLHMRLEEINRKLRADDVFPSVARRRRSVSPEPIYGADGKRVNTFEWRCRQKLEDERTKLIDIGMSTIPGFRAPGDFKRANKVQEKVYIPAREYPDINFIGLLIGPRGNTLKKMEADSGAKISIRGKGSVKEGKVRADGSQIPGEEEELHALVTADSEEKVRKCIETINNIMQQAVSVPDGQMELKKIQLRELAALNGTLRDEDLQICQNCGQTGHRRYDCPEERNFTQTITCRICGLAGHVDRDCKDRNNPEALEAAQRREMMMNAEYQNLMSELGGPKQMDMYGQPAYPAQAWMAPGMMMPPGMAPPGMMPPGMEMPPGMMPPGMEMPPGMGPPGMEMPPGMAPPGMNPPPPGMNYGYPPHYNGY